MQHLQVFQHRGVAVSWIREENITAAATGEELGVGGATGGVVRLLAGLFGPCNHTLHVVVVEAQHLEIDQADQSTQRGEVVVF